MRGRGLRSERVGRRRLRAVQRCLPRRRAHESLRAMRVRVRARVRINPTPNPDQATPLQLARALSVGRVDRLRAAMPFARKSGRARSSTGHSAKTASAGSAGVDAARGDR